MDSENKFLDVPDLVTEETMTESDVGKVRKKPRYSYAKESLRSRLTFLGFEGESSTPTSFPATLDLDKEFFPEGLKRGSIVEVKGPENCGKTFLLTYLISNVLRHHPSKKVILIDTSHQFSIQNLVSILSFQNDFKSKPSTESIVQIVETTPELVAYLDRLIVINCYSAEEYLATVALKENSLLERLVKQDPDIALIAIDTLDCYTFKNTGNAQDCQEILSALKTNCRNVPVICSTINLPNEKDYNLDKSQGVGQEPNNEEWFYNIKLDPTLITHTLVIRPVDKDDIDRPKDYGNSHFIAYLRSKQRANIAGSDIHLVKFSIFSDMLWFK